MFYLIGFSLSAYWLDIDNFIYIITIKNMMASFNPRRKAEIIKELT